MSQININDHPASARKKAGVRYLLKRSLKIDMTPMVDLGFLLITFFVVTAKLSEPNAMNLYMPKDGPPTSASQSRSITFLLAGDNKLFYYYGTEEDAIKNDLIFPISYDEKNGVGKIIREKQLQLEKSGVSRSQLIVLIKPGKESTYKNSVDILDEMTINGVSRYAIVKPGSGDLLYLEKASN
ncbi:MAG: biopolymer transporter ExbD [Bacteroidota bacterium]